MEESSIYGRRIWVTTVQAPYVAVGLQKMTPGLLLRSELHFCKNKINTRDTFYGKIKILVRSSNITNEKKKCKFYKHT